MNLPVLGSPVCFFSTDADASYAILTSNPSESKITLSDGTVLNMLVSDLDVSLPLHRTIHKKNVPLLVVDMYHRYPFSEYALPFQFQSHGKSISRFFRAFFGAK